MRRALVSTNACTRRDRGRGRGISFTTATVALAGLDDRRENEHTAGFRDEFARAAGSGVQACKRRLTSALMSALTGHPGAGSGCFGTLPSDRGRVFDEFERAAGDDIPGVGRGLAIVKELCRILDGTIRFETREGHGTTFEIRFPVQFGASKVSDCTVYPVSRGH